MSTIINRLCALLLLIVMIFSGNIFVAQASDTTENAEFMPILAQEFDALSAMNLLTEDFLTMSANMAVYRAQFVGALYKLAGFSDNIINAASTPFEDVTESTPYKEAISYFYNVGIINGTSSTTFNPYGEISYIQAIKIAVDFLGYGKYNKSEADLYSGYISIATRIGLTDGLKISSFNASVSAEAAVVLLYNCAISEVLDTVAYDANGQEIVRIYMDDSLLAVYHSIYSGRGNMDISLNGELCLGDTAVIDGYKYETDGKDFSEFLGYSVRYFYKSVDGTNVLLWIKPDSSNEILTIDSEDLLTDDGEYGFDKIVYQEQDSEKRRIADIDLYADVVYNNALCNNATIELLKPKVGNIKLIDNDGDRLYDVVIVKEFRNLFVSAVSLAENFIADKFGTPLMLDEYDYIKIIRDGEEISLNQVSNNCLISYLAGPDKKYLYLYVNDSGITGVLQGVTTEADETCYTFDGGDYWLSETLKQVISEKQYAIPEAIVGNTYRYFLDISSKIAAITEVNNNEQQYAYLIDIGKNRDAFAQDSVLLKLLLQDGNITTAVTADKLKIDDAAGKKGKDLPTDRLGEVVKVSFNNEGAVREIDYADVLDESVHQYGYDKTRFTLDYAETNSFYYRNYLFGNRYAIGADTICFATYANKDGSLDYGVARMSDITNNATYENIKIYDCDEFRDIGALCISIDRRGRYNSGHILLNNIKSVSGENDEIYTQLVGLVKGKEVTYTIKDQELINEIELKRGDIIRCSTYLNEVYQVELVHRLSNKDAPFIDTTTLSRQSDSRVLGYLYSNNGNNIVLMNPNGWSYGGKLLVTKAVTSSSDLSVSVYNAKSDKVYPGSVKDLYDVSSPLLDGSLSIPEDTKKVFIYREAENVGEIIVAYY